jgi:hypothetical protein
MYVGWSSTVGITHEEDSGDGGGSGGGGSGGSGGGVYE